MHNDIISFGPITIHGYGLMIGIGVICALILGEYRAKKYILSKEAVSDIAFIAVISGIFGAKLLYVLMKLPELFTSPLEVLGTQGFVVYGGIILGVFAVMLYCHLKKYDFITYFDLLMPSVAVAQAFGRIGCFLAGCCYGRETSSVFGVVFPSGSLAPSGVKLMPTQLFSSVGDFLIAVILILCTNKIKYKGNVGTLYLLLYGIGRFMIEFMRNDERGNVGILSTSQFISILIIIVTIVMFVINCKSKKYSELNKEQLQRV